MGRSLNFFDQVFSPIFSVAHQCKVKLMKALLFGVNIPKKVDDVSWRDRQGRKQKSFQGGQNYNFCYRKRNINRKIKSSLYSRYYAETCNEWRGLSPRLDVWTAQLRRNVAAVASCWRRCVRFQPSENQPRDLQQ